MKMRGMGLGLLTWKADLFWNTSPEILISKLGFKPSWISSIKESGNNALLNLISSYILFLSLNFH